jgi:hypothetical protein
MVVLAAFVSVGTFQTTPLSAGEDANIDKMIESAKTAADHEAIAAAYEKQAAEAKSQAAMHAEMEKEYKKVGGALIAKQHVDTHCDSLTKLYQKIAAENEALANAHKAMAKEAK